MRPPTRMRQVYDGGPPGKFRFPKSPLTVVFIAVLAFLLVHRLGVFSVDDDAVLPSRLDVAADQLSAHYDRNSPQAGRVVGVEAGSGDVVVSLLLIEAERETLRGLPRELQESTLSSLCPAGGDQVWDLISGEQVIRVRGVDESGRPVLTVTCSRHRI